ncbi:MAG: MopE-related protein [Pseudomonadota bacterium]
MFTLKMPLWCLGLALTAACNGPGDTGLVDADGDGYEIGVDCDDDDAGVHPGADEACNQVDDDCDGEVDEATGSQWYEDSDGDGFGNPYSTLQACEQPEGWVDGATDCDDDDAGVHPGADERCNLEDDDCDGAVDESPIDAGTWYPDADRDGYGDDASAMSACQQPSGTVAEGGDCDDTDAHVHPDADERCNGVDDDCDGATDEADAIDPLTWYQDDDGDGYGQEGATAQACASGTGWAVEAGDCDDTDAGVHPGADEYCDELDSDCDGEVAEDDSLDAPLWHPDADADGYGDAATSVARCSASEGLLADGSDCDDTDAGIHPDADEVCDLADNDCDGLTDDPAALDAATWYQDADADGWGVDALTDIACWQPSGFVALAGDCDDTQASVNPDEIDLCGDGADADCDGMDSLCPAAGDLLITEIMKDPAVQSDSAGEWVELTNVSAVTYDLQGMVLADDASDHWQVSDSLVLGPGEIAVLCRSVTAAASCDLVYSSFQLANDGDEVILATWGTTGSDGDVIHEVIYADTDGWPDLAGASMSLDPGAYDSTSAADPANWCDASTTFETGDYGTPGVLNGSCF